MKYALESSAGLDPRFLFLVDLEKPVKYRINLRLSSLKFYFYLKSEDIEGKTHQDIILSIL